MLTKKDSVYRRNKIKSTLDSISTKYNIDRESIALSPIADWNDEWHVRYVDIVETIIKSEWYTYQQYICHRNLAEDKLCFGLIDRPPFDDCLITWNYYQIWKISKEKLNVITWWELIKTIMNFIKQYEKWLKSFN